MDQYRELCLEILDCALHEREFKGRDEFDMTFLMELQKQGIVSVVYPVIKKKTNSIEVDKKITSMYAQNVHKLCQVIQIQKEVDCILKEAKVSYAIIKGTAVAKYYPVPSNRGFGDIDILINPDDMDKVGRLLTEKNYALLEKARHHDEYKRYNVSVEIHRYPSGLNPYPDELKAVFINGLKSTELDTFGFPNFETEKNGLILLLHMYHHIYGGMGLRHIADWMMFAENELTDEKYVKYEPILKEYGFLKFAKLSTKTCQVFLGMRKEGYSWCQDVEEDTCRCFIEYIYQSGEFGNKRSKDRQLLYLGNNISRGFLKKHHKPYWFGIVYRIYLIAYAIVCICGRKIKIQDLKKIKEYMKMHTAMGLYDVYENYSC